MEERLRQGVREVYLADGQVEILTFSNPMNVCMCIIIFFHTLF